MTEKAGQGDGSRPAAPRVLIFDSGVGGLSVAHSIAERLPAWQLVYLADNAFFPYGEQPEQLVIDRCVGLIATVTARQPVDMIVIGCNTASTVVLPALRQRFGCPVIGVVPAIKPAALLSRNRRIGLLATPATIRRPYLEQLIREFAGDCQITRVGSSELVRLVEAWMMSGVLDPDALHRIIAPLAEADVDTVVLGCTHFPLVRAWLQPLLDARVNWVDSGSAIARRLEFLWHEPGCNPPDNGGEPAISGRADHQPRLFFSGTEPQGLRAYLDRNGWPAPVVSAGLTLAP